MEHSSLQELLYFLEYGTDIHITISFLENYGNKKTHLSTDSWTGELFIYRSILLSHFFSDVHQLSASTLPKLLKVLPPD